MEPDHPLERDVFPVSGVMGTLRRQPDAVARTTARVFYDAPLADARDEPAVAPARTARQVRVHHGDAPAAWAAHHHVGVQGPGSPAAP